MYICVLDQVPNEMVPVLVAHSVLRHHMMYEGSQTYEDWCDNSFKKCVVSVNQKEFDKICGLKDTCVTWESNTLDGIYSCATIVVSDDDKPNVLKFAKLRKPKSPTNSLLMAED